MATQDPTTEEELTLGKLDDGRPTSAEEFANAIYDEPWTYERVDGRLVVMAPEGTGHVIQSEPWLKQLYVYSFMFPETKATVVGQAWIHIDEVNTRIADIAVYLGGVVNIPEQVPDIVFEIVSPGKVSRRRDYVEKRAQYEKLGIREYVIVDRFDKKVTVLTLGAGGYTERVLTLADVYNSPLLPGLEVRLAEALVR
jgi:Uma2 family endonuclease